VLGSNFRLSLQLEHYLLGCQNFEQIRFDEEIRFSNLKVAKSTTLLNYIIYCDTGSVFRKNSLKAKIENRLEK